jgi:hypothetical protein
MSNETFTAYRFTKRNSDCAMIFVALVDNGFSPQWANEAECKSDPKAERALLIQLPIAEAVRFREYRDGALAAMLA